MNRHLSVPRTLAVLALLAVLAGCKGTKALAPVALPDTTPPPAPTGLHVDNDASSQAIMLAWDASPAPDVAGYAVYLVKQNQAGANVYSLVGTCAAAATDFALELPAQGVANTYQLKAYDTSSNFSAYSAAVMAYLPAGGDGNPAGGPQRIND